MLRAATGRDVVIEAAGTGTSIGAALLAGRASHQAGRNLAPDPGSAWAGYAAAWRAAAR